MYYANKRETERLEKQGKKLSPFYEDLMLKRSELAKNTFSAGKWMDEADVRKFLEQVKNL